MRDLQPTYWYPDGLARAPGRAADVDRHLPLTLVVWLLLALVLFPFPEVLVSGGAQRIVQEETGGQPAVEESSAAWSAVMGSFICVLAAVMLLSTSRKRIVTHRGETVLRWLWLSYMAYCGIQITRGAVTGEINAALLKLFLPVIILTMCYMARHEPYERVYGALRWFIWGYSVAVLCMLVVHPRFVVMEAYKGVLPGVSWRVHGFHHANQIGLLIAIYWLLRTPAKADIYRPWVTWLFDLATMIILVLTQSKTSFLILIVGTACNVVLPACRRSALTASVCVAGVLLTIFVLVASKDDIDSALTENTDLATGSISSLSNRTLIWDMALFDCEESPWFGYGANMWWQLARISNGKWTAPHAHNQLLQTMWEVGIVGTAVLAIHLGMLLWAAWLTDSGVGHGLFAATLMYAATGASEVPLPSLRCSHLPFLIYVVLFLAICSSLSSGDSRDQTTSSRLCRSTGRSNKRSMALSEVIGSTAQVPAPEQPDHIVSLAFRSNVFGIADRTQVL